MGTSSHEESPLFLMRFWGDDEGGAVSAGSFTGSESESAHRKWCGKLLRVSTGEARYFCGLPDLLSILDSLLSGTNVEDQSPFTTSGHD